MANHKKTFTPTKLNISDVQDQETRNRLEMKFSDYRVQKQLSVETQRKAMVTQLEAKVQEANAQIALTKFLLEAGAEFDEVQTEPFWFAYKSNGDIILESPFTERDMRNGIRLQRKQMEAAAENMDEGTGSNDLYETDEGEEQ
jgi:hypothetical protein